MKKQSIFYALAIFASIVAAPFAIAVPVLNPAPDSVQQGDVIPAGVKIYHHHRHCHFKLKHGHLVKFCHKHRHVKFAHHG